MKLTLGLIALWLSIGGAWALAQIQAKKTTVAVLDFQSSGGISTDEVKTLCNRFRGLLVKTSAFDVLEREKMGEILKAQDFNMSDACNTQACAVEVGKLLGVEAMIAGDIGKIGETFTIDLRMIDVGTSKILSTQTRDFQGRIDGLLATMTSIAASFAKVDKDAVVEVGDIYIASNPPGAEILINGKPISDVTPKLMENMTAGSYHIELRLGDLRARKTVDIKGATIANLELTLELPKGRVRLLSSPMQAIVRVDTAIVGQTPLLLDLPIGRHILTFSKPGYAEETVETDVVENQQQKNLSIQMRRVYSVTIMPLIPLSARTSPVLVSVDGKPVGQGTVILSLTEGEHNVVVSGSAIKEQTRTISVGGPLSVTIDVEPLTSSVATEYKTIVPA
ncbi:MAG TPA: PEGA domain-containing protein, partial [bacterium]|nr:PEGA domain-containing protein [bacterium]